MGISPFTHVWLVVLTILKNVSQWEGLSHILWEKKCSKPPTRCGLSHFHPGGSSAVQAGLGCRSAHGIRSEKSPSLKASPFSISSREIAGAISKCHDHHISPPFFHQNCHKTAVNQILFFRQCAVTAVRCTQLSHGTTVPHRRQLDDDRTSQAHLSR